MNIEIGIRLIVNYFELTDFLMDTSLENAHVLTDFVCLFFGNSLIAEDFGILEGLAHLVDLCVDVDQVYFSKILNQMCLNFQLPAPNLLDLPRLHELLLFLSLLSHQILDDS